MKLDGLSRRADGLLGRLTDLVGRLETTLASLDTAPLGPTLRNARQATDQLNEVLYDLKQYPSGFIFGQSPAPARGLERTKK